MLLAIAVLGVLLGLVTRFFMASHLPLMVREGIIMGFVFSMARDGVEVSLPKVLGGMFMFFLVFSLIARFGLPIVVRWLDSRAAGARARTLPVS
jgi:ABC-type Fe3+-siderophore transport system permease subunit